MSLRRQPLCQGLRTWADCILAFRRADLERAVGVRGPPLPGVEGHFPGDPVGPATPGRLRPDAPQHQPGQAGLHSRVSQQRLADLATKAES